MGIEEIHDIAHRYTNSPCDINQISGGHINQTYHVSSSTEEFILQLINEKVFEDTQLLNRNIKRISQQLKSCDYPYEPIEILDTLTGESHILANNLCWRALKYIPNGIVFEKTKDMQLIEKTARAFGEFSMCFIDVDPSLIGVTIKRFHDPEMRFQQFMKAIDSATKNILNTSKSCIEHGLALSSISSEYQILIKDLPKRVTHNDAKIGNVLFDQLGNIKAIIDFDTVMPGYLMHDFGDMARSMCNSVEEDENLPNVNFSVQIFHSLAKGYLSVLEPVMTDQEILSLIPGIKTVIYTQFIRFLTDYLNGNTYYTIDYPEHNLNRAKVQLKLLLDFLQKESELEIILHNSVNQKS